MSYFNTDILRKPEVVAGLFRAGQITVLAGRFNIGKTPLLTQINTCVAKGVPWCGRSVMQKHVAHIDFESAEPDFILNYRNICAGHQVEVPKVPDEVTPFLFNGPINERRTNQLIDAATSSKTAFEFLRDVVLKVQPESHISIDPVELLFPDVALNKGEQINKLFKGFRRLFLDFPLASTMMNMNLRKRDRRADPPDLLKDPHGWMEEVSGHNNLLNRCDVRFGMDKYGDTDIRIFNGIRRNEEVTPMLLTPVDDDPERLGGFRARAANDADLAHILTPTQLQYYMQNLPQSFRFNEVAGNGIPRKTLHRMVTHLLSVQRLSKDNDGVYHKC